MVTALAARAAVVAAIGRVEARVREPTPVRCRRGVAVVHAHSASGASRRPLQRAPAIGIDSTPRRGGATAPAPQSCRQNQNLSIPRRITLPLPTHKYLVFPQPNRVSTITHQRKQDIAFGPLGQSYRRQQQQQQQTQFERERRASVRQQAAAGKRRRDFARDQRRFFVPGSAPVGGTRVFPRCRRGVTGGYASILQPGGSFRRNRCDYFYTAASKDRAFPVATKTKQDKNDPIIPLVCNKINTR